MTRTIIPCTNCGDTKYFEGLCWRCAEAQRISDMLALTETQKQEKVSEIAEHITDSAYTYDVFMPLFSSCRINTQSVADAAFKHGVFSRPRFTPTPPTRFATG